MTEAYRIRSDETWADAREDYLTGFSAEEVCRRYDIGLSALRRRAREEGWRRRDQADPNIADDDLDVFEDVSPFDLVEMAWRRLTAAVARGQGTEAARWQRIHADLHARAEAELTAARDDDAHVQRQATLDPAQRWFRKPRLTLAGENVHDVHSKFLPRPDEGPLSRAERRRREREARKRS